MQWCKYCFCETRECATTRLPISVWGICTLARPPPFSWGEHSQDRPGWLRLPSFEAGRWSDGRAIQHSAEPWQSNFPTDDKARQAILGLNLCSFHVVVCGLRIPEPTS